MTIALSQNDCYINMSIFIWTTCHSRVAVVKPGLNMLCSAIDTRKQLATTRLDLIRDEWLTITECTFAILFIINSSGRCRITLHKYYNDILNMFSFHCHACLFSLELLPMQLYMHNKLMELYHMDTCKLR